MFIYITKNGTISMNNKSVKRMTRNVFKSIEM